MSTQPVTAAPVGRSAQLASTVEPGENFGRFNLPMSTRELVVQIADGKPCEVPRFWLNTAMQAIEQCFGEANIKEEADRATHAKPRRPKRLRTASAGPAKLNRANSAGRRGGE